jgi:hypothetical protein
MCIAPYITENRRIRCVVAQEREKREDAERENTNASDFDQGVFYKLTGTP